MAEEQKEGIRLDGSHGIGTNAHLTIVTADKVSGQKEVTYELPYGLLNEANLKFLKTATDIGYIVGYRVERIIPAGSGTLVITRDGIHLEGDEQEGR